MIGAPIPDAATASHGALERVGTNRPPVGLQCHINNRGDCKESFAWEYSHQGKRQTIKIVSLKRVVRDLCRNNAPQRCRLGAPSDSALADFP
jgi:hypothetical protein